MTVIFHLYLNLDDDSEELSREIAFEKESLEFAGEEEVSDAVFVDIQDEEKTEPLTLEELQEMEAALLRGTVRAASAAGADDDDNPIEIFADDVDSSITAGKKPFQSGNPVHEVVTVRKSVIPLATDEYQDAWDDAHVKLACSPQNSYRQVADLNTSLPKWELVKSSLTAPITNSRDLEEAIMSYNPSFVGKWSFLGLHALLNRTMSSTDRDRFFSEILPRMVNLAIQLPDAIKRPIPLLAKYVDSEIVLSQYQVAVLLANAFFCTFPRRSNAKATEYQSYPSINFNTLFSGGGDSKLAKLRCVIHYFDRVGSRLSHDLGRLSFRRQVLDEFPEWDTLSACTLGDIEIRSDGTIEDDGVECLQIDFANKLIGGGVLGEGCVQEEIRFVINTECLVSRLFTAELEPNECLIITGAERYSNYTGYRASFAFAGDFVDKTPRDGDGRIQTVIVGIDAVHLRSPASQYRAELVLRELNKAYCGFFISSNEHMEPNYPKWPIATGNWGCGAFGGHKEAKSLIQLMAAAPLRKKIFYFTFGEHDFENRLRQMYDLLRSKKVTVAGLLALFEHYRVSTSGMQFAGDLFSFISRRLSPTSKQPSLAMEAQEISPIQLTP